MPRITRHAAGLLAALALAGCSEYGTRAYGVQRGAQDQTRVASPPPLSLPPILTEHTLTADAPPADTRAAPGTTQAAALAGPSRSTRAARSVNAPRSSGETSLLDAAGPSAPGDIREKVDQDAQLGRADPRYSDALLFGADGPRGGTGQPPIIQRDSKSWLSSIF